MIVDAQVHVWAPETPQRPWLRRGDAHLPKPFGYEDLRAEMVRAGIDRAVLIPPGWEGDRIDFVLEGSTRHPDRFAAMGRIAIEKRRAPPSCPAGSGRAACSASACRFRRCITAPGWTTARLTGSGRRPSGTALR